MSRQAIGTGVGVALTVVPEPFGCAQELRRNPFEFLAPWVVVSDADGARPDRDQVLARTLSGRDGQLAVFVATRLDAQPDALVAWTRAIAELKRSKFVLAVGRFSAPPLLSDLAALPSPADRKKTMRLDDALSAIVEQSPYLTRLPNVVAWLPSIRMRIRPWSRSSIGRRSTTAKARRSAA